MRRQRKREQEHDDNGRDPRVCPAACRLDRCPPFSLPCCSPMRSSISSSGPRSTDASPTTRGHAMRTASPLGSSPCTARSSASRSYWCGIRPRRDRRSFLTPPARLSRGPCDQPMCIGSEHRVAPGAGRQALAGTLSVMNMAVQGRRLLRRSVSAGWIQHQLAAGTTSAKVLMGASSLRQRVLAALDDTQRTIGDRSEQLVHDMRHEPRHGERVRKPHARRSPSNARAESPGETGVGGRRLAMP